jgi:hypothetical protein
VINLTTEKVITDDEGYFGIDGVAGGYFVFSAVQYKSKELFDFWRF